MSKSIKAKKVSNLKNPWIIIDTDTGEVLDDAQGYGYKTSQKAHAAYAYKNRTPKQAKHHNANQRKNKIWWAKHKDIANTLTQFSFEISKGSWGPEDKFDYQLFKELLKENNVDTEDCNPYSLWNYYLHKL